MSLLIALIFATSLLLPLVSDARAEDQEDTVLTVSCISNLTDIQALTLRIEKGVVYLRSGDAAALSGYAERQGDKGLEFVRNGAEVSYNSYRLIDGEKWVMLDQTMNRLEVNLAYENGLLVAVGREHTAQDLFDITDKYILNNVYNLSDESNLLMKTFSALATLYNRLFNLFDAATGIYDQKKYFDTFKLLLDASESDALLKTLIDGNKLLGKLSKLQEYGLGTSKEEALMEMLQEGKVSDYALILPVYKSVTDPVGYLLGKTSVGKSISLGGLDIFTQVKLYSDIHSIVSCSGLFTNMLLYTYSDEAYATTQKKETDANSKANQIPAEYLPLQARNGLGRIKSYAKSNTGEKIMTKVLDEMEIVTAESLSRLFSKAAFGNSSIVIAIQKIFNDSLFPKTTGLIDFMETYAYLCKLQKGLPELYNCYRANSDTAINAKYAALLYLRIVQAAYEASVKSGTVEDTYSLSEQIKKDMEKILAISDSDLTSFQENEAIDVANLARDAQTLSGGTSQEAQAGAEVSEHYFRDAIAVYNEDSLYERFRGISHTEYLERLGDNDRNYGRRRNEVDWIDGAVIGKAASDMLGQCDSAYALLNSFIACEASWYDQVSSGIEAVVSSATNVSLVGSECYAWGDYDGMPLIMDEYYLFRVYDSASGRNYEIIYQAYVESEGGESLAGKVVSEIGDAQTPESVTHRSEEAPQSWETPTQMRVVNCKDWVSLRREADTDSERLAKVPYGEIVDVYSYEGFFAYCRYNDVYGYILNDYLENVEEEYNTCWLEYFTPDNEYEFIDMINERRGYEFLYNIRHEEEDIEGLYDLVMDISSVDNGKLRISELGFLLITTDFQDRENPIIRELYSEIAEYFIGMRRETAEKKYDELAEEFEGKYAQDVGTADLLVEREDPVGMYVGIPGSDDDQSQEYWAFIGAMES